MKMPIICILVSLLVCGCGGTDVVQPNMNVTVGQQLIDLKKAHDSGALSDKEFNSQKSKLIDNIH